MSGLLKVFQLLLLYLNLSFCFLLSDKLFFIFNELLFFLLELSYSCLIGTDDDLTYLVTVEADLFLELGMLVKMLSCVSNVSQQLGK